MIPRIIHYCWFGGGEMPALTRKCISSWQNVLPDYEIICWSEENYDINNSIPYLQEAYSKKKYAFVSDYVRLYALYNYGGVYLDTDVEVIRDFTSLMKEKTILGYETDESITTAFIAVPPKASWIKELLDMYTERRFIREDGSMDVTTNVAFISKYLKNNGFLLNGTFQETNSIQIYPTEYFSPCSWDNGKYRITEETYTIHYFAGTWHSFYSKILSCFFTNAQIVKIAELKEKLQKLLKKGIC